MVIDNIPHLPPGFRFHPTDEELVVHYLKRKAASAPLPVAIIADIDLYKFDPWELPSKAAFGEQEWYFFSPRDRKYPNGARPNRAATSGYWKATGTDKPILSSDGRNQKVGVKKALVFYGGKPPKGVKTNWIMHEYRLTDNNNSYSSNNSIPNPPPQSSSDPASQSTKKNSLRLDNWVLCRIYKKSNSSSNMNTGFQRPGLMEQEREICMEAMIPTISSLSMANNGLEINNDGNLFDGILGIGGRGSGGGGGYGVGGGEDPHHGHHYHHHLLSSNTSIKRPLASAFWNNETAGSPSGSSSSSKRFHGDLNSSSGMSTTSADENNSFISLLSQIPTHHHHQNTTPFLGSVGDAVLRHQFQLPSMNWTS